MSEIVVKESDAARSVTAVIGDRVKIELPENPTTGFRWQVASIDAGILRPQADDYVAGADTGVGGGGLRVFFFEAASSGAADVRLELKRSWEPQSPRSTFAIRVLVA